MSRLPLTLMSLALVLTSTAEAAASSSVHVVDHGAYCDGGTDDSAAIAAAAAAVPEGGRLVFPPGATCALLSHVELRDLDKVIIDGQGATLVARPEMPPGTALMKLFSSTDVEMVDLHFDGNALLREDFSGEERDLISGTGSNLMFYGADGLSLYGVTSIDAWHDSIYFDFDYSSRDPYVMRDVFVRDLYAEGAGRNNLTIINCTHCVFTDSTLADAATANFDIEPYLSTHSVTDVLLQDSVLQGAGASCLQVSQGEAIAVSDVEITGNIFDLCNADARGMPGVAISLNKGEDITIENNRFTRIDLLAGFVTASDGEACEPATFTDPDDECARADSRSVIDFADTARAVVNGNIFEDVFYEDSKKSSVFYFQNTASQTTHSVQNNQVSGVDGEGWCWVSDEASSSQQALVALLVTNNIIHGHVQSGCN